MGLFASISSRYRQAIDNLTHALTRAEEFVWLDDEITGGD
jgi:hypothetical protein